MSFDIGDPIPLAITVRDSAGVPANAGAVVLTITLPDGTSTTPALSNPSAGNYTPTAPFVATQVGRYATRWVATGSNASTLTDVFNVLAADPGFLISLADARAAMGTVAGNTVKDEDLRTFIAAATSIMEGIVGPILRTTKTETHHGGGSMIVLDYSPIISVSSVTEVNGSTSQAITLENTSLLDSYGYIVDKDAGILTRRAFGQTTWFNAGSSNVQVTYVAGRATIPGNILLAARRLIRHLWQSEQQGYRPNMGTPNEAMSVTPSGFAVPRAVLEMCGPDLRSPGVS